MVDSEITEEITRIFERAKHETLALVVSQPPPLTSSLQEASSDWLTAEQLAKYWQLIDKDGEPITAGIKSWTRRPSDDHPLPFVNMGDLMRFHREQVNQWAKEEAELRKAKKDQRRLRAAG